MKHTSNNEVEEREEKMSEDVIEAEKEEKRERRSFSLFTFWNNLRRDGEEKDIEVVNEEKEKDRKLPRFINSRSAVVAASLVIIAVAGYLNIRFTPLPEEAENLKNGVSLDAVSPENTEEISTIENTEDYFALSVINRERVRDEALEMLQDLTSSDAVDAVAKADAYNEMTRIANEITGEGNIESLVKAKGFNNCVAVISGDGVNVVVESDGLTINQVAQIKEIVYL